MKKLRKAISLLIACTLAFSLVACGGAPSSTVTSATSGSTPASGASETSELEQHVLSIVWPTLSIDFYTTMADVMKAQAEAEGWQVDVVSYDFNSATQVTQLENCETMGATDIITARWTPMPLRTSASACARKASTSTCSPWRPTTWTLMTL